MPRPTSSACSPLSRWGTPLANSITSMPRWTEPAASARVLPCSSVMTRVISARCASISSRKRIRMRARRTGGVARHSGNAACAAETAASTSAASPRGTLRKAAPVAGLVTSPKRVPRDAVRAPLIQRGTVSSSMAVISEGRAGKKARGARGKCQRALGGVSLLEPWTLLLGPHTLALSRYSSRKVRPSGAGRSRPRVQPEAPGGRRRTRPSRPPISLRALAATPVASA
jgi:hypothetical protein